ncbi:MAG TPA: hypothetical protein IGR89_15470 [Oscillatoriaceae cyanobacterium M7585_C2015_266]|nr:hypothetical protein [Oscillatoriaceae cyanobacterium M7585_C2015_266]
MVLIASVVIALVIIAPVLPTVAQRIRPQEAARQLYQILPDFPKENNYINRETGKVDPENTLASRLIRYHMYVKGRATIYRLDWKLTIADYLGANEPLQKETYPGREVLKNNPMESDRAAISSLNRAQREALVNALVSIFNPKSEEPTAETIPTTNPNPTPPPQPEVNPKKPLRGGAELLK